MRQSRLFTKTLKNVLSDEKSVNAQLLERGGFAQKVMAGVYTFLPLGLKVLTKIERIIREEMDTVGAQEMLMPALQPKANWDTTKRWDELDILFKIDSRHGSKYALGPTHEEIITPTVATYLNSYKDLPFAVYQIQTKFRDEPRAKSGLLRGREFRMKDLYSFHTSEDDLENYYTKTAIPAYKKIFERLGLDAIVTEASGGTFSKYSHEFQVEIENGEDEIFICENCALAKNKEIYKEGDICTNCGKNKYRGAFTSEVGNIFKLKTKFSESFKLHYKDKDGLDKKAVMGCYGIGSSRLMGVIVEKFHDEKGIIWPQSVAPFQAHLVELGQDLAKKTYDSLLSAGVEVLYDDRDETAGVKFADSDLLGIPYRVVVSEKTEKAGKVEVKKRDQRDSKLFDLEEFLEILDSRSSRE